MQSSFRLPEHRTWSGTPSRLVGPTVISFGLAGIVASWGLVPTGNVVLRAWLSSLSALAAIWVYVLQRYGARLHLRTAVLVMMGLSATHLLPPLYISVRLPTRPSLDGHSVADMYPLVALATVIGALALLIGYVEVERKLGVDSPASPGDDTKGGPQTLAMILLMSAVVWAARGILLASGAYYWTYKNAAFLFGRWYSVTNQIAGYGLIVPMALWLLARRHSRWRPWAWLATAAELAWVVPSGSTEGVLETLFGCLLVAWWSRRQLPRKWIVALLVVAVVVMPVIREYRYVIGRFTDVNRVEFGATFQAAQAAYERFEHEQGGTLLDYADSFAQRAYDAQFLGYLLKHYREVYNWQYGRTYYSRVPFVVLPYFVFPHRKIMQVPIDHWFKFVARGSSPSTLLGEAYVNFSWAGIVIVPLLLGMVLSAFDAAIRKRQDDVFVVGPYLLIGSNLPFMVTQSLASWLSYLRNAVLLLVAIQLAVRFLSIRRHREKTGCIHPC